MKTYSSRFLFSTFIASGLLLSGNAITGSNVVIPSAMAQGKTYTNAELHDWLESAGEEMVSVINSNLSKKEQKAKFPPIIDKYVDVNSIAKFCLGRFWRIATPEQRIEYTKLFHQVLINSITDRLGEYKGISFTMGRVLSEQDNRTSIEITLNRPKQPPAMIQWIISTESGSPKVVDIVAENASIAVTERSDYTSFITRNGSSVAALISSLKKQIARHP